MKILVILLSVFYFTSCSESAESLIENHNEEAQTKFNQFYACYEVALKTPPISHDEIKWKHNDANTEYGHSNVYQIGIESFKDLSQPLDIEFDGTRRREHADMARLFNIDLKAHVQEHDYPLDQDYGFHAPEDGESCRKAILHFLESKYLLINRLLDHSEPVLISTDTYQAGYIKGDVLVFDLESTKLLGGFTLLVESDKQMGLRESSDANANLMADLSMKAYRTIIEKFAALTPSVTDISFDF